MKSLAAEHRSDPPLLQVALKLAAQAEQCHKKYVATVN